MLETPQFWHWGSEPDTSPESLLEQDGGRHETHLSPDDIFEVH